MCCSKESHYRDAFVEQNFAEINGPNYESSRKLKAEYCIYINNDLEATFNLSESLAPSLRSMAAYRYEKFKDASDKLHNIASYLEPIKSKIANLNSKNSSLDDKCKRTYNFLNFEDMYLSDDDRSSPTAEDPFHIKYLNFTGNNNSENLIKLIKDFPKEWSIVQLTAPYNPHENIKCRNEFRSEIPSIFISLLKNDYIQLYDSSPITIELPANVVKEGEKELFVELFSLLEENLQTIDNKTGRYTQKNIHKYWERREDVDLRMKSVINVMDKEWLSGLKALLTGSLVSDHWRVKIKQMVDTLCADWGITEKQKILICNILECCMNMSTSEVRRALRVILTDFCDQRELRTAINGVEFKHFQQCDDCSVDNFRACKDFCKRCLAGAFEIMHKFKLVDVIKSFMTLENKIKSDDEWVDMKHCKRNPLILIVDERLDMFPWESLPLLNNQPISRVENIHFLYCLYKTNEERIQNGYYVVKPSNGRYLINPGNNLNKMEKRMSSFISYWCPHWCGDINQPPNPNTFIQQLKETDIFLYCGHGDGCQYACGSEGVGVSGAGRLRSAAILAGCGSTRIQAAGGRLPGMASHYHYHIANSPVVVGMLWEVTDLEVDKVVSSLLALFVPSNAPVPWESVGKSQWSQGKLDINEQNKSSHPHENDLLTAVSKARKSSNFTMISSSVVARGIPVRIEH